jgi:hypothetical protein
MGNGAGSPCDVNRNILNYQNFDEDEPYSPRGSCVYLNIYHLDDSWSDTNIMSQKIGLGGAFHAGVEIHGREWTYGKSGIECGEPRCHQVHVYHESICLGETGLTALDVDSVVRRMKSGWSGKDYHIFDYNCTTFADALTVELIGDHIPGWVGRLPQLASQAAALGFNV